MLVIFIILLLTPSILGMPSYTLTFIGSKAYGSTMVTEKVHFNLNGNTVTCTTAVPPASVLQDYSQNKIAFLFNRAPHQRESIPGSPMNKTCYIRTFGSDTNITVLKQFFDLRSKNGKKAIILNNVAFGSSMSIKDSWKPSTAWFGDSVNTFCQNSQIFVPSEGKNENGERKRSCFAFIGCLTICRCSQVGKYLCDFHRRIDFSPAPGSPSKGPWFCLCGYFMHSN